MDDPMRHHDVDPAIAEALESAYAERVDVEVAARHLWSIHRAAGTLPSMQRGVARTRRALVSVVAGSMLFMSSGGALAASGSALPGDVLYPVKRGVEKARIVLTVTREGDARLHLALAKRRMAEAREVADRRPAVVATLVREALDSLEVARRTGDVEVAMEADDTRREAVEELAAIDREVAAQLRDSRKQPEDRMAMSSETPSSSPQSTSSPSASAEPSAPAESPSAADSPSETPPASESASPTPSQTASPSESASPSPSSTPSESASPSASPSPSETASPSEPAPSSSPTRKYEGVEDTTAQADGTPAPAPSS